MLRPSRPASRFLSTCLLGLLLGPLLATAAHAARNPNAKIILHLTPWNKRNTCAAGRLTDPETVVTKGDLFPARYTVYALVVDGTPGIGISGVQFGIAFNDTLKKGVDILDWQECSLFNWPMPGWPTESLTGNMLTWSTVTDCDTTGIRVAGYFYLTAYSPDRLQIIPRPADGKALVSDCIKGTGGSNAETIDEIPAEHLGFIDFGGGPGYNPWNPKENLLKFKKPSGISVRDR